MKGEYNMKIKRIGATLLLMLLSLGAFLIAEDAKHAFPSLRMGVHARSLGMGGAFVGIADDASAVYWNPAGLANINNLSVTTMYSAGMEFDRTYNFFGAGYNTQKYGVLGFGFINAGLSDIQLYDNSGAENGTGDFGDNILYLGYAYKFKYFSTGLNFKMLFLNVVDDYEENGFGMDFGIYSEPVRGFSVGFTAADLFTKVGDFDAPHKLSLGIAFRPTSDLVFDIDAVKVEDEDSYFNYGAEYGVNVIGDEYHDILFRMGMNDNNVTLGFGVNYKFVEFNYAYVAKDNSNILGDEHKISLDFVLGKTKPMERQYLFHFPEPKEPKIITVRDTVVKEVTKEVIKEVKKEQSYNISNLSEIPEDWWPLEDVLFEHDSAKLDINASNTLNYIAKLLVKYPDTKVLIRGFASLPGNSKYNAGLANKRAATVKNYLIKKGAKAEQIEVKSYSDNYLKDTDEESRRVEIRRIK
jgi:outer membrane protein OmpA-like peptidoglycan-associated protein